MGWILHQAIVVTTYDEQGIKQAHTEAVRIFDGCVTTVVRSPINNYWSFLVPPDGSNEGWDESDKGDGRREEFHQWLLAQAYEDGSNSFDAVEVTYGETDQPSAMDFTKLIDGDDDE